jgi:hypothetical protein
VTHKPSKSHTTIDLAWAGMGKVSNGQLYEIGRSVSSRIQGGRGKQVLASITLQKIECLASKLVFGTNGLVLGSSMALIPTETT